MKYLKLYEELDNEFYEQIHHTVMSNLLIEDGIDNTIELGVNDVNILDGLRNLIQDRICLIIIIIGC